MVAERKGNGKANDEFAAELDRLVDEEVSALDPRAEPTVDALLDQLAERLRQHPDREGLLARLRESILGPQAHDPPPAPDPTPPSGDA